MTRRLEFQRGFTLIELMIVVALIGVLAAVAILSYQHVTKQAKAVEAEVALTEVNRLELVYLATHGSFSDDLKTIGFSMGPSLKYYAIHVQTLDRGASFEASALPLAKAGGQMAQVLARTSSGQVSMSKTDPKLLAAQGGGTAVLNGTTTATSVGSDGAAFGTGGSQSKPTCKSGGEATLAADGLLDMNFCDEGPMSRSR